MVIELMKKMRDEFKTTFIFSTHDQKIVGEAEIIYTIEDGELKDAGRREGRAMGNLFKIAVRNLLGTNDARFLRLPDHHRRRVRPGVPFGLRLLQEHDDRPDHRFHARHLQVHAKGYVASIDNLPLNLN